MKGLILIILISVLFLIYVYKNVTKKNSHEVKTFSPENKEKKYNQKFYSHIVKRPIEKAVRNYTDNCTNALFPNATSSFGKGETTTPCDPSVESNYYAARPILNSNTYHEKLEHLFKYIEEETEYDDSKLVKQDEFSNENDYKASLDYLMKKIKETQEILPLFKDYAKNDTWKGEDFFHINEKIFIFGPKENSETDQRENSENDKKFVISFTLYNTLRSVSTDIVAVLLFVNGRFIIKSIKFASKKSEKWVDGVNVGKKMCIGTDCINQPFGNTIENESFNCKGFKSEIDLENYTIKGGVPEELMEILQQC